MRWVAVGGPPLLTFLIALAGACLAWLIVERRVLPAACFACAAGVTLAGAALPVTTSGRVSASVAAVQGDVPHARNLPTLFNDTQITQNHATATEQLAAQVQGGPPGRARPRDLAGELHQPRPVRVPGHLPGDRGRGPGHRPADPGRRGPAEPGAQRRPALAAGPGPDHHVRQAPARAVRRGHTVPRADLAHHLADLAAAGQPDAGPPGGGVPGRPDPARRRDLLRGRLRRPGAVRGGGRARTC